MHNTLHARFGGRSARWLVLPAVLVSGVAWVSLATGAAAVVGITPTAARPAVCHPGANLALCPSRAPQDRVNLKPVAPVGALPRPAQSLTRSPMSAADRAEAASIRAQLHAAMQGLSFATGK